MRRWAFLFRPQWLALFVVVVAFAWLCFTVLAPWQLGKNTKTSRENSQIASSLSADPVPLTSVLPHQDSSAPDQQWHRVSATGHYLSEAQVVARLRSVDGDPAYEVLTPVRGGQRADGAGGPRLCQTGPRHCVAAVRRPPPAGPVTIIARLRDAEPMLTGKDPFRADGAQQVYSINPPPQVSQVTGGAPWPVRICSWWTTSPAASE